MAGKPNIRSIRFSDELAELIDRQAGDTFTQLADIQRRIDQERERLFKIQKATEELRRLEQNIQSAQHYFGIVERQAKTIAEAAEQDVTQTEAPAPLVAGHDCVTKGRKRNVSKKL